MANQVVQLLGRRLRLGLIGGGPGSFIGEIHRSAARLDGCYEIATGVLSSDPDRAREAGKDLGFAADRCYSSVREMLDAESSRTDGIDVVAIMTPNDTHYEYAVLSLEHGMDVICDKPLTRTLQEAEALVDKASEAGLIVCLTHNYSGYSMVRQARGMIAAGQLGTIRLVQVEYVQGGRAREALPDSGRPTQWRYDPERAGESLVLGDIGTHAHHLIRFVSGQEVVAVCADVGSAVPERSFHDCAGVLLRFQNGARGVLWATQAAAGVENYLRFRISGTLGTLEWELENPAKLLFKPLDGIVEHRTPNGPGTLPLAARTCRIVAGHPGGFAEAFASIYRDAAEAIAARRAGAPIDPLACHFPTAQDGLEGLRFIRGVMASSDTNGQWITL